jgi:hypothetical protein
MTAEKPRRIGILIGQEKDWPDAFLSAVNESQSEVTAELVQIGGTFLENDCPYTVIVDRTSNEVPYFRAYLKHAALHGCYIINNPFTWSADSKFFGLALARQMGLMAPRTVALPNKFIRLSDAGPDAFRNLAYPMDWEGIIAYVGVPAVFKDINSGGQHFFHLVHNVDDLIQRYDESGTHSMILQQFLQSDQHVHCMVVDEKEVLLLHHDRENGRYHPHPLNLPETLQQQISQNAIALTQAYHYDINLVEFVIQDGQPYVTNCTNAAPIINRTIMNDAQFDWCIQQMASLAINRAQNPSRQTNPFAF